MCINASTELTTLEEVEAILLHRYDVPRTQMEEWEEWGSLKQGEYESAHIYCTRVQEMFTPTYLSEKAATSCLLSKAKLVFRNAVLRSLKVGQTLTTLREATSTLVWQERLIAMEPRTKPSPLFQNQPQQAGRSGAARHPPAGKRPASTKQSKLAAGRSSAVKTEPSAKKSAPAVTGCYICGDDHMARECPKRHAKGCPACGGECPSLRGYSSSHVHRASKAPAAAAARRAEEDRPFIDLRSPSEEGEVKETKGGNAPPNQAGTARSPADAPRDPRYVSGWRINERYAPRRQEQAAAETKRKEDGPFPASAPNGTAHGAEPVGTKVATGMGPHPPTSPTPQGTSPTVPPVPTQVHKARESGETGKVPIPKEDDPQQTDPEVPPSAPSREGGEGATFIGPPETLPGEERAYRGGLARPILQVVEVSSVCTPSVRRDTWPTPPECDRHRVSSLLFYSCSSRRTTSSLPHSPGYSGECVGPPKCPPVTSWLLDTTWVRTATTEVSSSPSARATGKRPGWKPSGSREDARHTSGLGPSGEGTRTPPCGNASANGKRRCRDLRHR